MLNWGIVGASEIASNFCAALHFTHQSTNAIATKHEIIAIASRSLEAAQFFAAKHNINQVYNSYEALAADSKVHIVYVANIQHYDVVLLMLTWKKHVVCEKPMGLNHHETSNLIALAKRQNVFLMEALWSRFFPVYQHLSTVLDSFQSKEVREIYIKHGYVADMKKDVHKKLNGGATLNIASYAIQLVLYVFRDEPKSIRATGKVNIDGVDLYCEAELIFSANRRAHIICSCLEQLENNATIITTKGPICIPLYWRPSLYMALGKIHEWQPLTLQSSPHSEYYYYSNAIGLRNGADEITKFIKLGSLTCPIVGHEDSKRISKIQDEIRKQLGVRYDSDKN